MNITLERQLFLQSFWHARCVGEERVGAQELGFLLRNECDKGTSLDVGASIAVCKAQGPRKIRGVPRTFCYNIYLYMYFTITDYNVYCMKFIHVDICIISVYIFIFIYIYLSNR